MAQPGIPPFIAELTGPFFLGILFNWALFGALSIQVYIYYLAFPRDRRFPTKALVGFVYFYDAIQTFLITRDGFKIFGSGWGNMQVLDQVGWVWVSVPLMTGVISAITQIFYAWRIWILSEKVYISCFIVLIALSQGAAGIWNASEAHRIGQWSELQMHSTTSVVLWLGGTAVCDAVVAAAMLYYLYRSRSGFRHTNALLVKLIRITVETGFVTAAVAIVDLILYLAFKNTNYHLTPALSLSKLYSNSLMTLLNARLKIIGGRNTGATATVDRTLGQSSWVGNLAQLSMQGNASFVDSWDSKPATTVRSTNLKGTSFLPLQEHSRNLSTLRFQDADSATVDKPSLSFEADDVESQKGYTKSDMHVQDSQIQVGRARGLSLSERPLPSLPKSPKT